MAEIINLNQFRKARAKAEKERKSTNNRVKFGRLKADRDVATAQKIKAEQDLDCKKIETLPFPAPESSGPKPDNKDKA